MSRPSKSRLTRWADLVMPHIPSAPSTAISVADLMAKTGLREQEVHHAVGFIRDEMAEIGGRPLVSSGEGYRFTFDEAEVAGFRSTQTRRAFTTMRRLWHGVLRPYLASLPAGSHEAKQAQKQMGRALEDLGEIVTVNGRG
jgi:hypothetical protein